MPYLEIVFAGRKRKMKFDGNKWMSAWELMLAAVFIVFLALYADYIKHLKFPYTFSSETLIFDGDATYALGNNTA